MSAANVLHISRSELKAKNFYFDTQQKTSAALNDADNVIFNVVANDSKRYLIKTVMFRATNSGFINSLQIVDRTNGNFVMMQSGNYNLWNNEAQWMNLIWDTSPASQYIFNSMVVFTFGNLDHQFIPNTFRLKVLYYEFDLFNAI